MTKAMRRHHIRRIKNQKRQILMHLGYNLDEKMVGKHANSGTICSCLMCGNPRKYFGEKTKQELLSELEMKEFSESYYKE